MTFVRFLKDRLRAGGIDTADLELKILLEDIAGISGAALYDSAQSLPADIEQKLIQIVDRRLQGEPLGRILGYRDFWKNRFYLSPDTLEPRPDTETLIEAALSGPPPRRILDLGTGSGCILLTLLDEWPLACGVGVDKASGACLTAQNNANKIGVAERVTFLCGDWLSPVEGRFDLIVSNPPYIPSADIPNLDENVRNFDPILALDGGEEGLDPYKYLLPRLKNFLEPDGRVLFEIGQGQGEDLLRLVKACGANLSRVVPDLRGIPRVVEISYGDN